MSASEHPEHGEDSAQYTGRDVIYRDSAISALDVQRAADTLLRQGIKPSVAAVRDQLGGGSPNTLTPLLSKYWETLGQRLGAGPESLERVPENLARVTELLWRRALEEARERLKLLQEPGAATSELLPLQEQLMKLSVALAEARAREGEQLTHLATLSKERAALRAERGSLLALLKSTQALLEQQSARVGALERARAKRLPIPAKALARSRPAGTKFGQRKSNLRPLRPAPPASRRIRARKPK
jgi:Plasmid replication region DNA-binding N-term